MIFLFWLFTLFPHPVHVSVTEIEYNDNAGSLQITSRIFIDDLVQSIASQHHLESLDLFKPSNKAESDKYLMDYLKLHFNIKLDGKSSNINYIAYEIEEPAVLCYLEIEKVKKFKYIQITNSIIQETYKDQSNIINVTYKGQVKSLRLVSEKPFDILHF